MILKKTGVRFRNLKLAGGRTAPLLYMEIVIDVSRRQGKVPHWTQWFSVFPSGIEISPPP